MSLYRRVVLLAFLSIGLAVAGAAYLPGQTSQKVVRIGIAPFQDTVLPVVPEKLGWYKDSGLRVQFIDVGWTDIPLGLASDSFDVVLYSFEATQPSWASLKSSGKEIVFYAPLYAFNGAAIMVHGDAGFQTLSSLSGLDQDEVGKKTKEVMVQLKGKKIGITEGTISEKVVRDALAKAGMTQSDVSLINARYEDNLAAFLARRLDAFVGGLPERVKARQAGAVELLVGSAVSDPAITGWVATRAFAEKNREVMQNLIDTFYKTMRYMEEDLKGRANLATEYLRGKASVDYSPEEFAFAWSFQYFPKTREEAAKAFLDQNSPYYWKRSWQNNNNFLLKTSKITEAVPFEAFWGEKTLLPN
jgi:ABC-type nitrate/sulfonate/bicarbonate transport system substrate-binding protein